MLDCAFIMATLILSGTELNKKNTSLFVGCVGMLKDEAEEDIEDDDDDEEWLRKNKPNK